MKKDISIFTLQRMPVYLNYLRTLPVSEGGSYISSGAIASALGLGEVLVRKDLAFTDCVGRPKVGYVRDELIKGLEDFLCCNEIKRAVVVGVGGLGKALLSYGGFGNFGIELAAGFDCDPDKIGENVADKPVYGVDDLGEVVDKLNATLAIISVPARYAQEVANGIVDAGVKAILNFAPVRLRVPKGVEVINIDVAANLAVLAAML